MTALYSLGILSNSFIMYAAPEKMVEVLLNDCFYVPFFALFVTFLNYFVHNFAATVSFDRK